MTTQMIAGSAVPTGDAARASDTAVREIGQPNRGPVAGAAGIGGIARSCSGERRTGVLGPRGHGAPLATAGPASDVVSRSR
jgi:hypothetical protein